MNVEAFADAEQQPEEVEERRLSNVWGVKGLTKRDPKIVRWV